jgi:hypothetical protein
MDPSLNGDNGESAHGKDAKGRFVANNKFGKGNPHAQRVNVLRTALLDTSTYDDAVEVVKKLIELAKGGNVQEISELLNRWYGKANQPVELSHSDAPDARGVALQAILSDPKLLAIANDLVRQAIAPASNLPSPSGLMQDME